MFPTRGQVGIIIIYFFEGPAPGPTSHNSFFVRFFLFSWCGGPSDYVRYYDGWLSGVIYAAVFCPSKMVRFAVSPGGCGRRDKAFHKVVEAACGLLACMRCLTLPSDASQHNKNRKVYPYVDT